MNSPELVERIWKQTEPSVFISRREFYAGLEGWEITAKEIDGETVGATLVRGPEFHFVSFGFRKVFPASLIQDCLQPILDERGFVRTRTPKEDTRQRRFNQLIGFVVTAEDEHYVYFCLHHLNLHGTKQCRS